MRHVLLVKRSRTRVKSMGHKMCDLVIQRYSSKNVYVFSVEKVTVIATNIVEFILVVNFCDALL